MGFAGRSVLTATQTTIANREFTIADIDRQFSDTAQNISDGGKTLNVILGQHGRKLQVANRAMFGPPHHRRASDLAAIIEAQERHELMKRNGSIQISSIKPVLISPRSNHLTVRMESSVC
jgi:hypothetical protein